METQEFNHGDKLYVITKFAAQNIFITAEVIGWKQDDDTGKYYYYLDIDKDHDVIKIWYDDIYQVFMGHNIYAFKTKKEAVDYHNEIVMQYINREYRDKVIRFKEKYAMDLEDTKELSKKESIAVTYTP